MSPVRYEAMTERNAGFLSADEQARLASASVFVCGVGGMGGAALQTLVRAGVGSVDIADFDVFEASNLNRQVFACADTLAQPKAFATADALRAINPRLEVGVRGAEWVDRLDDVLPGADVVVNGMDDIRAAIRLYRAARRHRVTVVDAFVCPHPSVFVVGPDDPRPEEWLGFPTVGVADADITDEMVDAALMAELGYVAAVSRGLRRLDAHVVAEVLRGERPRPSFAPVVLIAGNLMAFEAIGALLGRPSAAGHRGYFVDPWSGRIERPGSRAIVALRRRLAGRLLARHLEPAS